VEYSADYPYGNRQYYNDFISVPNRNASGISELMNPDYHYGNCGKDIHAKDNQQRSSSRRNVEKSLKKR
jgi:hypothetical protein